MATRGVATRKVLAATLAGVSSLALATPARAGEGPAPAAESTVAGVDAKAMKKLPFTWYGQETYYYCGPGATKMVLSARMKPPPSQKALGAAMGTDQNGTDYAGLAGNVMNKYLKTNYYQQKAISDPPSAGQVTLLKKDVVNDVNQGYGIVANVVSGWRPPGYPGGTIYHFVAVVGYDAGGDKVLIADPAAAGAGGSSWRNVPKTYTIKLTDLATWIGSKAYVA